MKFKHWNCDVHFSRYRHNNQIAIQLTSADDLREPIAVATCMIEGALSEEEIRAGFTTIKDYSENEGMLSALQEAGIVGDPIRYEASGFITAPVVQIKNIPASI